MLRPFLWRVEKRNVVEPWEDDTSGESLKPFCWNRDNARMTGFSCVVYGAMRDQ